MTWSTRVAPGEKLIFALRARNADSSETAAQSIAKRCGVTRSVVNQAVKGEEIKRDEWKRLADQIVGSFTFLRTRVLLSGR